MDLNSFSLFTNALTLLSAGVVDAKIINRETELLDTLPVTPLECLPL